MFDYKFLSQELSKMHRDLGAAVLCLDGTNPLSLASTHTFIEGPVLTALVGRNPRPKADIRRTLWDARKTRRLKVPTTCVYTAYDSEADVTSIGLVYLVPKAVKARWNTLHAPQDKPLEVGA